MTQRQKYRRLSEHNSFIPAVNRRPRTRKCRIFADSGRLAPNASAKDKREAAVYNYITIQADNKTPKQIYEEIAPYIGGGI